MRTSVLAERDYDSIFSKSHFVGYYMSRRLFVSWLAFILSYWTVHKLPLPILFFSPLNTVGNGISDLFLSYLAVLVIHIEKKSIKRGERRKEEVSFRKKGTGVCTV